MNHKRQLQILAERLEGECPASALDDPEWSAQRDCANDCDDDDVACWVRYAQWKGKVN